MDIQGMWGSKCSFSLPHQEEAARKKRELEERRKAEQQRMKEERERQKKVWAHPISFWRIEPVVPA